MGKRHVAFVQMRVARRQLRVRKKSFPVDFVGNNLLYGSLDCSRNKYEGGAAKNPEDEGCARKHEEAKRGGNYSSGRVEGKGVYPANFGVSAHRSGQNPCYNSGDRSCRHT